ncbi:hypothetical protein WICPIJ_005545 [Wickerhamomyces pijperi]|uniref:protein-tyrosine-phosphatase n=1 Tax=Wickerhamomyces pijperi TaxID=599730 RepID=A0A9P8Q5Y4_WICPI|nr:hypothetical protein WICPIJ_005545 [Wickerhamomyces pijperi]
MLNNSFTVHSGVPPATQHTDELSSSSKMNPHMPNKPQLTLSQRQSSSTTDNNTTKNTRRGESQSLHTSHALLPKEDGSDSFLEFGRPRMSHFNANNDSYNSLNSIETDSSLESTSLFSERLKFQSHSNSFFPPPNPFANFDSQMISPVSSSFDRSSISASPSSAAKVPQYARPRPSFHHSSTSIPSLTSSHNKTFSSSSINSNISSNSGSINFSLSPLINKKAAKYQIPKGVATVSDSQLKDLIHGGTNLLVVDVRSYLEFNKSHIQNAINFNLPTTLLKRPNYNLKRCLNNITAQEKTTLADFLLGSQHSRSVALIYDDYKVTNEEVTLGLYGICNKFLECEEFQGEVVLLKEGFQSFKEEFSGLTTISDLNHHDAYEHKQRLGGSPTKNVKPPRMNSRSLSLANLPSAATTNCEFLSPPACGLSKFKLPTPTKVTEFSLPISTTFKIRHNEESHSNTDIDKDLFMKEFGRLRDQLQRKSDNMCDSKVPDWLNSSMKTQSELFADFKTLEIQEKDHINSLIRDNSLSFGIELGYKNRYKDIFPYETTRVKLGSTGGGEDSQFYINGNLVDSTSLGITSPESQYIVTQAPLTSTMDDFVRVLFESQINMIVCLTDQFENVLEKCHAYWDDGNYFQSVETVNVTKHLTVRKLRMIATGTIVWHFQVLNWLDLDVISNQSHLVDLFGVMLLKKQLIRENKINPLTMVHCSAGCGRTGTFCTLDTIVGENTGVIPLLRESGNLVFKLVENFRKQRMSMVQSLRQYLFLYEALVYYYREIDTESDRLNGILTQVQEMFIDN